MSRRIFVIRHAKAEGTRLSRSLLGKEGGAVNEEGQQQIEVLRKELLERSFDLEQPVAVSELQRTVQTAHGAGFAHTIVRPVLNEVHTSDPANTQRLIAEGKIPEEAIVAARAVLAKPPPEGIWITHGLVIAGLSQLLGLLSPNDFIPGFCEIREIEI